MKFGHRWLAVSALAIGLGGSLACADDGALTVSRARPKASASPAAAGGASASPTPCPAGQLCGSTGGDSPGTGGGSGAVLSITVEPKVLSVNSPPTGGTSAGFVSSGQLTATVTVSGDATTSVTWTSDATDVVSVDAHGLVQAMPGAPARSVTITARSDADSAKSATATVAVTTDGVVNVGID